MLNVLVLSFLVVSGYASTSSSESGESIDVIQAGNYQFPFMVSIRRTEYEDIGKPGVHICAGALLESDVVVTAAHCMFDRFGNFLGNSHSFTIVAGSRLIEDNTTGVIRREAQKIFVHPRYTAYTGEGDIAVIILDSEVPIDGKKTCVIRLPINGNTKLGDKCTLIGWNNYIATSYPVFLENPYLCQFAYGDKYDKVPDGICTCPLTSVKNICYNGNLCTVGSDTISQHRDRISVWDKKTNSDENPPTQQPPLSRPPPMPRDEGDPSGILVCNDRITGILLNDYKCNLMNRPQIFTNLGNYLNFLRDPHNFLPSMDSVLIRHTSNSTGVGAPIGNSFDFSLVIVLVLGVVNGFFVG